MYVKNKQMEMLNTDGHINAKDNIRINFICNSTVYGIAVSVFMNFHLHGNS